MATFSPAPAGTVPWRRPAGGLLLALALHGALLLVWRQPRPPADGAAPADAYPLLTMRLYAAPVPVRSAPRSPPPDRPAHPPSTMPRTAPVTPPGRDAGVPALLPAPAAAPTVSAAPSGGALPPSSPALDIDALKAVARRHAGDGEAHALPGATPTLSASDKAQRALEGARRPKCDQNYRPMLGPVGFKELLALPLMLKEGASDSGCHW